MSHHVANEHVQLSASRFASVNGIPVSAESASLSMSPTGGHFFSRNALTGRRKYVPLPPPTLPLPKIGQEQDLVWRQSLSNRPMAPQFLLPYPPLKKQAVSQAYYREQVPRWNFASKHRRPYVVDSDEDSQDNDDDF